MSLNYKLGVRTNRSYRISCYKLFGTLSPSKMMILLQLSKQTQLQVCLPLSSWLL